MATATRWTAAENKFKYNVVSGEIGQAGAHSTGTGFFGGDGLQVFDLGDGRTGFTTGDTIWATAAGQTRSQCTVLRNSLGIMTGYDFSTASMSWYTQGTASAPEDFFKATSFEGIPYQKGTSGAILIDDVLLAVGALVLPSSTFPFFSLHGGWAELLYNISGTPDTWERVNIPFNVPRGTNAPHPNGSPQDPGDGYIYFPMNVSGLSFCRVSHQDAKRGDLTRIEWLDSQGRFKQEIPDERGYNAARRLPRYADAETGNPFGVQGGSPSQRASGLWQMTGGGLFINDIIIALGDTIEGLYYGRDTIYTVPDSHGVFGSQKYIYAAEAVPWLTFSGQQGDDHVLMYSTNGSNSKTLTITGSPTGGTFRLTYSGQQTSAIAYNANASTVQAALEALSNLAPGDVIVTGGPGPSTAFDITFPTSAGGGTFTASGSFTGGTSPGISIAGTSVFSDARYYWPEVLKVTNL